MKVITLAATKGGVGKSTLTCGLAVIAVEAGFKVGIMDCDPQGSARDWHALRGSPDQPMLLQAENMNEALGEAKENGIEWLFVDTPPGLLNKIEAAVRCADLVVVPVRPSPMDLLGVSAVVAVCEDYKRNAVFVLNQVPPGSALAKEAVKHLKGIGKLLAHQIPFRESYCAAMAAGETAGEQSGGEERKEMQLLWREVKRQADTKTTRG